MCSSDLAGSIAAAANIQGGERVQAAALGDGELEPVRSFEDLRWLITQGAVQAQDLHLQTIATQGGGSQRRVLALSQWDVAQVDANLMQKLGFSGPYTRPVLGEVLDGGAAQRAGLKPGDEVVSIDGAAVRDGAQLRQLIRDAATGGATSVQQWRIVRGSLSMTVGIQPESVEQDGQRIGRIAAYVGSPIEMVQVEYGWWEGLQKGWTQTWEVAGLTLRMMGQMLAGDASVSNLSGPITIADYAGRSASVGLAAYFTFVALISVSLGVLNLLPLPVLDGGHLMYYLWELGTGRAVSDQWAARLQQLGVAILVSLMAIAIFNDINRMWGP